MGFRLKSTLVGYEFRAIQSGVSSQSGKPWMNVIFEEPDTCAQVSARVPADMQQYIHDLHLKKGSYYDCEVVGIAGDDYAYINLLSLPLPSYDSDPSGVDC